MLQYFARLIDTKCVDCMVLITIGTFTLIQFHYIFNPSHIYVWLAAWAPCNPFRKQGTRNTRRNTVHVTSHMHSVSNVHTHTWPAMCRPYLRLMALLATFISPISTTLMTQSFLLMIQRNGTTFFEILRHQQPLWVSTQTGIKRRSKILELELLQEQSILRIKQ